MSRSLWLVAVVLGCCPACRTADQEARGASTVWLKSSLPGVTHADPGKWGLRDWEYIGTPSVGQTKPVPDTPDAFTAPAQLWCRGTTPDGKTVKVRRIVELTLVAGEGPWRVRDYRLESEEPLTFVTQTVGWLVFTLGGLLLMLALGGLAYVIGWNDAVGWVTLFSLAVPVWAASECYGTGWAGVPGLVVYLLVIVGLSKGLDTAPDKGAALGSCLGCLVLLLAALGGCYYLLLR